MGIIINVNETNFVRSFNEVNHKDAQKLMSKFFNIEEITILKGGKLSNKFPAAFARNIAFRCINKSP